MVVLLGMMIVSPMPIHIMGVLAVVILPDLNMTRSQLGLALSAVTVAGAALAIGAGGITDKVGGRRTLWLTYMLGFVALGVVALAPNYFWLLVAMMMTGVMQAFSNPSTNWMISRHYPPGRRGVATGVKQSGVQVSLLLCGLVVPSMAQMVGWRVAVAVLVVLPIAGVIGTFRLPLDHPSISIASRRATRQKQADTIKWLAAYSLMTGVGHSSIQTFVPLFANESMGLGLAAAGGAGALIGALGVVSRISWTRYVERLQTMRGPLAVITGGSAVAALGLLSATDIGPMALWISVVVAGATMAASNAVVMLCAVTAAIPGSVGRASGLVIVFFLIGKSIGPSVFGWLVDRTDSYQSAWGFAFLAFVASGIVLFLWSTAEHRQKSMA